MPQFQPLTDTSRRQLRATFDSVAEAYDAARPEYPAELFDALIELAGLSPGDRLLEVGPGPGKATLPLAQRGFAITAVELGSDMAEVARAKLAAFGVHVECASFEHWPLAGAQDPFDLVFAATAWHWIDPAIAYRRAHELLKPGGHLAFWSAAHVMGEDADPIFNELRDAYREIGGEHAADPERYKPRQLPNRAAVIADSGLFEDIQVLQFDWRRTYDADGYIALLGTFSDHIAMQPAQRERLYAEIRRRLSRRSDGTLRRHWGAVLHVARAAGATPGHPLR